MDPPDPQYLRPSISAETYASRGDLASACRSGDFEKIKKLATRNDSGQSLTDYLTYGLVPAFSANQIGVVRYLLNHGADPNDRVVTIMAARGCSLPIFEALLKKGWNINVLVLRGVSTLSCVVKDETVVQWFLAHGASPKLGPPGSVLNATASIGTPATFQLLLRQGASLSRGDAFRSAAGSPEDAGRIPMLTYLIDVLGLEVDPPDENVNGQIGTPIHSAIRSGGLEKVKFLVWKGANLQRRNRMGFTPLEVAEKTLFMQIRAFLSNASRTANGRKS